VSGLQCQGPHEASVLSHRWGNELQLEILILEDAVESRATLGAAKWPVALTAAILGELGEQSQPGASSVETAKLIKGLDLLRVQDGFRGCLNSRISFGWMTRRRHFYLGWGCLPRFNFR